MSGYDLLSLLLIALVVIDWASTAVLIRAAHRLKYIALQERAGVSVMLSVLASAAGLLGLLYLLHVSLPVLSAIVIVGVFLGISLPQVVWGYQYLRGRFDE